MFTSIVVALDLEGEGDRALPIARDLSRLGDIPVELLTVASPLLPEEFDVYELRRRANANGWAADSYVILHDNDPARAIVDYLDNRPGALLVMATSAKSPMKNLFLGSVSEAVLNHILSPVLLVGPHVPAGTTMTSTRLIACVDSTDVAAAVLPVITSWTGTFDNAPPWVVEVLPAMPGFGRGVAQVIESSYVRNLASQLVVAGVEASFEVLHGDNIVERLEEFTGDIIDAVLVATSTKWTDGHTHWHSTTRRIVQRTIRPVLVVPSRNSTTPDSPQYA